MNKKILTIPNILTVSRFVLSPLFFIFLLINKVDIGLIIFIIAALTDLVDGWIARHKKQKTIFGKIIDPMADKFMVLLAVIALILKFNFPIFGILILSRDIVSLYGSALVYFKNKDIWVTNILGKLTTAFQVITIICFITRVHFKFIILLFTIGLSFLTAIIYFIKMVKIIRKK